MYNIRMDEQRLKILEEKIDHIYVSVEKIRKSFRTTLIVSIVLFVLPMIGLVFAIPSFLQTIQTETTLTN